MCRVQNPAGKLEPAGSRRVNRLADAASPPLGWQQVSGAGGDVPGAMSPGCPAPLGSSPGAGVSGLSLSLGKEGIQRVCPLFCNSQAGENSPSHPCHPPGACCCPSLRKSCVVWAPGDTRGPWPGQRGLRGSNLGIIKHMLVLWTSLCACWGFPGSPGRESGGITPFVGS